MLKRLTANSGSPLHNESVAPAMGKRPKIPNSRQKIRGARLQRLLECVVPVATLDLHLCRVLRAFPAFLRQMSATADSHSSHLSHHFFKHVHGNQEEFNSPTLRRRCKDGEYHGGFDYRAGYAQGNIRVSTVTQSSSQSPKLICPKKALGCAQPYDDQEVYPLDLVYKEESYINNKIKPIYNSTWICEWVVPWVPKARMMNQVKKVAKEAGKKG
ncbi:hypothetical protein BJ138DRAFT_1097402 [Hygrophoropsis aurantiaca]|uniref:Uncharacterized protein n=1 Tax=Hygrophoropsis aurantiaca TaxID=72124 RepID=A0ACB8ASR2_9AGAM|nr:hypothetical protein BJ138DRAFT_1097402 [Hygrophoropsis aurantiaca]